MSGAGVFNRNFAAIFDCFTCGGREQSGDANLRNFPGIAWPKVGLSVLLITASLFCAPSYGAAQDATSDDERLNPRCGGVFDLCGYHEQQSDRPVIPATFERAMRFSEGLAAVRINGLFGYIDTTGSVVISPAFDLAGPFAGGYAEIRVGNHTGVIDRTGKIVLWPGFARSVPLSSGIVVAQKGQYKPRREPESDELERFHTAFMNRSPMGLYDLRKGWVTTDSYRFFAFAGNDSAYVWAGSFNSDSPKIGLMAMDGTWKVKPSFDAVERLNEGRAVVSIDIEENGKSHRLWGAVDPDGKLVIPLVYDRISGWRQGYAVIRQDGQEGFLDTNGRLLGGRLFQKVERDELDKPLKVLLGAKWFGISSDGTLTDVKDRPATKPLPDRIGKLERTKATQCGNGALIIRGNGLWGLQGPDGTILVEPEFEAISCFHRGVAWVPDRARNAWCPIGPDGKRRAKPDCQPVYYEFSVSHEYPEKLDADPFESSVLWTQAFLRHAVEPSYPAPRLVGDRIQSNGVTIASCRQIIVCD
jgi:hypothetical protein